MSGQTFETLKRAFDAKCAQSRGLKRDVDRLWPDVQQHLRNAMTVRGWTAETFTGFELGAGAAFMSAVVNLGDTATVAADKAKATIDLMPHAPVKLPGLGGGPT